MNNSEKAKKAIELINKQGDEIINILNDALERGDASIAFEQKKRWKERTIRIIAENVSQIEAEKFRKRESSSVIMGSPLTNLKNDIEMYLGFLVSLTEELEKYPDDLYTFPVNQESEEKISIPSIPNSKDVFIIHGHDELNLLRLKEQLKERWNLQPIVLSAKPGKGRTIIEKFEQEAKSISYALALFTTDDFIELENDSYYQARPNVIFELGWFYGRLSRQRVCIIYKEGAKIPSDLDGISRVQFKDSILEVVNEIERELVAANILHK